MRNYPDELAESEETIAALKKENATLVTRNAELEKHVAELQQPDLRAELHKAQERIKSLEQDVDYWQRQAQRDDGAQGPSLSSLGIPHAGE